MKIIIRFLTMISLLNSITLTLSACERDNHLASAKKISAAINDNIYHLTINVGITKEYLIQQITNDFIKQSLSKSLKNKFNSKFFEIIDIFDNATNIPVANPDLSISKKTINATLHFSYYKVYDQTTHLIITIEGTLKVIDISTISDITINMPFKFKVIRKNEVTKQIIEENIFPVLSQKFITAVNEQNHIFIEENKDFKLDSDALVIDDYTNMKIKNIMFSIKTIDTSQKLKESIALPILVEPFVEKIDLNQYDDILQNVEVELNNESYYDVKTRISPSITQTINKLDNTALENKDYQIQFKNQKQKNINFKDIVRKQELIYVVIKAIKGENKPFINEKDIKLEIDDKWL